MHAIRIVSPASNAPKTIQLFVNQPSAAFENVGTLRPAQEIRPTLDELEVNSGHFYTLDLIKFLKVNTLTLYIKDSFVRRSHSSYLRPLPPIPFVQKDAEMPTIIDYLQLVGK